LKVFLGYAAGVGKTWRMLDEAQDLRRRGVDVVIGYFEPHGRSDTIAKAQGLEMVPRRSTLYRGAAFEEMDTAAILRRKPGACAVDELAHTNVPGSDYEKRWQDVELVLDNEIDVLTTVNVQHLESLNDEVWRITGIRVRETVPDWVVDKADEVVMVDLTPEALRNRLERGAVYPPDKAARAMDNFFTEPNLRALREMALRHTAHDVEERVSGAALDTGLRPAEPVMVCLTARPSAAMLIRRGKRVADYMGVGCLAIHVTRPGGREAAGEAGEIGRLLSFARNLRIGVHVIEGDDVAQAIVDFGRQHAVTQIFLGRGRRSSGARSFRRTTLHRVVALAKEMEVTIVAEDRR
jgi:two-component system sensor histidine kinase KdpD